MNNDQRSNVRVPNTNHITFAGRLGNDPDLRYTPSGTAVVNFDMCNTRHYKSNTGEKCEESCWIAVTAWERLAEYIGENLSKGVPVIVEGKMKQETWADKETGKQRSRLKIQAISVSELEWRNDDSDDRGGGREEAAHRGERGRRQTAAPTDDRGDDQEDIPF
jgi:single-strand DNA-binding protein